MAGKKRTDIPGITGKMNDLLLKRSPSSGKRGKIAGIDGEMNKVFERNDATDRLLGPMK